MLKITNFAEIEPWIASGIYQSWHSGAHRVMGV